LDNPYTLGQLLEFAQGALAEGVPSTTFVMSDNNTNDFHAVALRVTHEELIALDKNPGFVYAVDTPQDSP
jgi:hypothetical protein